MKAIAICICATVTSILCSASPAQAQQPSGPVVADISDVLPADPGKFYKEPGYSPYAGKHYPARPLFGDEHVHTGWSVDAGLGGATLSPEDAVRFARGEHRAIARALPL